jgi:hypothetical protein
MSEWNQLLSIKNLLLCLALNIMNLCFLCTKNLLLCFALNVITLFGICFLHGFYMIRKSDKHQLLTQTCTTQTTSWLVHSLSLFGAWTSHEQTWTHKIHHSLDLGEVTTFPLIVYSMPDHGTNTKMSFCSQDSQAGVLKFPKLGFPWFWGPITLREDLRLKWGLK